MIAIDTNILVRILIEDEQQPAEVQIGRETAKKYARLFIPAVVQIELVWVLDFDYKLTKNQILIILKHLDENDAFELQHENLFVEALTLFEEGKANFADYLIYLEANNAGYSLITFDKKFAKFPKVKLLRY